MCSAERPQSRHRLPGGNMERRLSSRILPVVLLSVLRCGVATENQVLVESWKVTSDIRFRFATTQIRSVVLNSDSDADREAQFHIVLPEDAFISNFTMEMDGVVSVGVVKEKEEAKADYEAAKERGESAGLFRTRPRHTNKFDYSVNVHPLQRVIFTLTYQEVLRRKFGRYDHVVHLLADENVGHMSIDVRIHETKELSLLEIPDLPDNLEPTPEEKNVVLVDRPTPTSARIHYEHAVTSEATNSTQAPPTFTVRYDVKRDFSAGEVLVVDGYFVHFFAPSSLPAIPKDIIFVLDVSGSMIGHKMTQLKQAMTRIVQEMREQDRFNILTFHGHTSLWRKQGLTQADVQGKEEALTFVSDMQAHGMTNIHAALTEAVQFLLEYRSARHVPVIFFLTDGLPSTGTRSAQVISQDVKKLNDGVASIHGLAFGDDADYDLLKKVSSQNAGVARKIYEASDAVMQVTGFYDEISTVTLDKLQIEYVNDTVDTMSLTKTDFKTYFNGSEVMVAGKLANLNNFIDIMVKGIGAQGEINLVLDDDDIFTDVVLPDDDESQGVTDHSSLSTIAEKSWAFLTIKHLLQEKIKSDIQAEKDAIDKRILELSLKYSFVTPLTSIVVIQDKQNTTKVPAIYDDDDGRESPYMMSAVMGSSAQQQAHFPHQAIRMHSSAALPTLGAGIMFGHPIRTRAETIHRRPTFTLPEPNTEAPHFGLSSLLLGEQDQTARDNRRGREKTDKRRTGVGGKRGKGGKIGMKKQKRLPPDCRYLGISNLLSMNFTAPAFHTVCHVDGPRKFPPGEITLFSTDDGFSIGIVTAKGERNINGLVSLVLSLGNTTTLVNLGGAPNVTDLDFRPLPGYTIRRTESLLEVTSADLELRLTRAEGREGRKRCSKWAIYTISILHRGRVTGTGNAAMSVFPDACKMAVSKKFLKMRRRPPQRVPGLPANQPLSKLTAF